MSAGMLRVGVRWSLRSGLGPAVCTLSWEMPPRELIPGAPPGELGERAGLLGGIDACERCGHPVARSERLDRAAQAADAPRPPVGWWELPVPPSGDEDADDYADPGELDRVVLAHDLRRCDRRRAQLLGRAGPHLLIPDDAGSSR